MPFCGCSVTYICRSGIGGFKDGRMTARRSVTNAVKAQQSPIGLSRSITTAIEQLLTRCLVTCGPLRIDRGDTMCHLPLDGDSCWVSGARRDSRRVGFFAFPVACRSKPMDQDRSESNRKCEMEDQSYFLVSLWCRKASQLPP